METSFSSLKPYPSLEALLKEEFGLSRNYLKKSSLPKNYLEKKVREKDIITLPLEILNRYCISPSYKGGEVKIIAENEDMIFLSKPPGVHCHPMSYEERDNILSFLREKGFGKWMGQESWDKGLLYRLDYETSGLLIFVKDPSLHTQLREGFSRLVKEKIYRAVVSGHFQQEGIHTHHLIVKGNKGNTVAIGENSEGTKVELKSHLLSYDKDKDASTIEIELFEGHRHQIRVQLSALGHPILGDQKYGGEKADRLYLHAYRYRIEAEGKIWESICEDHF